MEEDNVMGPTISNFSQKYIPGEQKTDFGVYLAYVLTKEEMEIILGIWYLQ